MYTHRYTDWVNSVLTTVATDNTYMLKYCATAQKIGTSDVTGTMIQKSVVPDEMLLLTSAFNSGIIMYN